MQNERTGSARCNEAGCWIKQRKPAQFPGARIFLKSELFD